MNTKEENVKDYWYKWFISFFSVLKLVRNAFSQFLARSLGKYF